jgi:fatty acid desaturase
MITMRSIKLAHDQEDLAIKRVQFPKEIRTRIQKLQERNNWYNFFALAYDWGLIALSIIMYKLFPSVWVYFLSILIIGSRMRAFDNLMHEASHALLFKNRVLNRWIGSLFAAYPVFTSYSTYCKSHFSHHKYLWDTEKDPDTKRYELVGLDKPQEDPWKFLFAHVVKPIFLLHVPKYIYGTICVNLFSKDESLTEKWSRFLYWIVIIGSSILFDFWMDLILFWFVPLLTTFQVLRYWAEMAEHSGLKSTNLLLSSRNTFGNPIERFLIHPHHDNYHLVHHLFPAVPHYNLRKAHLILMELPEYREAHHCSGYFKSLLPGVRSVIEDIGGRFAKLN